MGRSAGFEQQDGQLADIEVNIVLFLVRDEGTEETADDAVPGAQVLLDELVFDETGDLFLLVALVDG